MRRRRNEITDRLADSIALLLVEHSRRETMVSTAADGDKFLSLPSTMNEVLPAKHGYNHPTDMTPNTHFCIYYPLHILLTFQHLRILFLSNDRHKKRLERVLFKRSFFWHHILFFLFFILNSNQKLCSRTFQASSPQLPLREIVSAELVNSDGFILTPWNNLYQQSKSSVYVLLAWKLNLKAENDINLVLE